MAPKQKEPIILQGTEGETETQAKTRWMLAPEFQAVVTLANYKGDDISINAAVKELGKQIDAVHNGDLKRSEAMLISQAHTLDEIFNNLARKSHANMSAGHSEAMERYMKLALRAQGQCRATLETLSTIKNPPVVFAKQANINNGNQQINNGTASPARETVIEQSKQSGDSNELLTDTRTSQAASRVNQTLETVGEIHRAEIG